MHAVRNPLPATGGVDAETIEEVRQHAPAAFRATQFRAVTEDDYRAAALTVGRRRGCGRRASAGQAAGYTVFVGIDPAGSGGDPDRPRGHTTARADVPRLGRCGPRPVPSRRLRPRGPAVRATSRSTSALDLCVMAGFFRGDVVEAVIEALAARPIAGSSADCSTRQLHVRSARLPEPDLRHRRAMSRVSTRPTSGRSGGTAARMPASATRASSRSGRGRSPSSTTIRAGWRTGP